MVFAVKCPSVRRRQSERALIEEQLLDDGGLPLSHEEECEAAWAALDAAYEEYRVALRAAREHMEAVLSCLPAEISRHIVHDRDYQFVPYWYVDSWSRPEPKPKRWR